MAETSIQTLDHTIQITNSWLKRLESEAHFDERHHAYSALRAVMHALRDRLTPEMAVKFGAQLPILVRGIFYEGWHMASSPTAERSVEDFLERIERELPPNYPRDAMGATRAVFQLLWEELDPGEIAKVVDTLPVPLRSLWPSIARR